MTPDYLAGLTKTKSDLIYSSLLLVMPAMRAYNWLSIQLIDIINKWDGDIQPKTFQFHWFVTKVSRFFFQIGHKRKWTIFCKSLNKLCNFPFTSIPLWNSNTHFVFHIFIEFCGWIKVSISITNRLQVLVNHYNVNYM